MRIQHSILSASTLCLLAVALQAQGPQLSERQLLNGDSVVGAATGDQSQAALATGDTAVLAAWSDRRAQLFQNSGANESQLDIWVQRLAPDGTPLDPAPTCLGFLPGDDVRPRVTWGNGSWLVSWSSQAPGDSIFSAAIVGMRVAANGALLDPAPFPILSVPNTLVTQHAAASDGQQWVVVAGESTSGLAGISAVRVANTGTVLDATPIVLQSNQFAGGVDLAFAQGVWLLTWHQDVGANGNDIRGKRFTSALTALDAVPFNIGASTWTEFGARCVSNGSQFLVAWQRSINSTGQSEVRAARVATTGQVLDPATMAVSGNMPFNNTTVCAGWDGLQWYVAWTYFELELARISSAGSVLDFDGFPLHASATLTKSEPALAGSALGGVLLAWTDSRAGSFEGLDLYVTRSVDANNIGPERVLSLGAPAQLASDSASSGSIVALAYRSESSGAGRIVVARSADSGVPLDPEPIEISNDPRAGPPCIAWDGAVFLIAWASASTNDVRYRRMLPNGVLLDPVALVIGPGTAPELAGRNGQFLLAYARAVASFPVQQHPALALIRGSDGVLVNGPLLLSSNYAAQFDVCATPTGFVVAWQRNYSVSDTHSDVNAVLVDDLGNPGLPFWVAGSFNSYNSGIQAACSGNEILFAWTFGTASNLTRRLDARRLSLGGSFLDAQPFRIVSGLVAEQFAPAVAWDGNQYLCAFQDLRNQSSALDQRSDIYGARILASGVVQDTAGFLIERTPASETRPSLVGLSSGRALIASSILVPTAPYSAFRLMTRTFEGTCPPPQNYCTAKLSSIASLPQAAASGSTSIAANNLAITLTQGVPNKLGILLRSKLPAAIPFANGTLCLQAPLVRSAPTLLNAQGFASIAVPLSAEDLGAQRCYQWWTRDPLQADGTGVSLSDGVQLWICP